MVIRLRTVLVFLTLLIALWFLYAERGILTPFIVAAMFAYVFNPSVTFFSEKIKLPRTISVIIIYLLIVGVVVAATTFLTRQIIAESSDIRAYATALLANARTNSNALPAFIKPTVVDFLSSLQKSRIVTQASLLPYFPRAISQLINFILFIVSGYYFLKEGKSIFDKGIHFIPSAYKVEVEILLRKINSVLGSYLRGQIFLVFLMSLVTFICLSIVGVRFALLIAIFSGLAEIVPVVGPLLAGSIATIVVLITGTVNFGLNPIEGAIVVICIYFVLRYVEDYLVVPHIMGKITKLPPFVIFFAAVAGGHLWGILGLVLAVPVTASLRLLLEFFVDQVNKQEESKED